MSGLQQTSPVVRRTLVVAIVSYFVVFGYAMIASDWTAYLVAQALFGLIAIGLGGVIYLYSPVEALALRTGAACLVVGGVAQFGWILTGRAELDLAAFVLVVLGIGLYVYAGLRDESSSTTES